MTLALSEPMKSRANMSARQRIKARRDEIAYALDRVVKELDGQIAFSFGDSKVFVGLTTEFQERNNLQYRFALDGLKAIIVAAGRISRYDNSANVEKPIVILLQPDNLSSLATLERFNDLFQVYTVLADSWAMAIAPKGEHAKKTRHTRVTETELNHALRFATERCANPEGEPKSG